MVAYERGRCRACGEKTKEHDDRQLRDCYDELVGRGEGPPEDWP